MYFHLNARSHCDIWKPTHIYSVHSTLVKASEVTCIGHMGPLSCMPSHDSFLNAEYLLNGMMPPNQTQTYSETHTTHANTQASE